MPRRTVLFNHYYGQVINRILMDVEHSGTKEDVLLLIMGNTEDTVKGSLIALDSYKNSIGEGLDLKPRSEYGIHPVITNAI